jgi:hypothetical protein
VLVLALLLVLVSALVVLLPAALLRWRLLLALIHVITVVAIL